MYGECSLCVRTRKLSNEICADCRILLLLNDVIKRKAINTNNVVLPVRGVKTRF